MYGARASGQDCSHEKTRHIQPGLRAFAGPGSDMMDPDYRPLDLATATALVRRIKRDIDSSTLDQRDILLADLLCAAWPSCCAQEQ
jgi:hypothetical protein